MFVGRLRLECRTRVRVVVVVPLLGLSLWRTGLAVLVVLFGTYPAESRVKGGWAKGRFLQLGQVGGRWGLVKSSGTVRVSRILCFCRPGSGIPRGRLDQGFGNGQGREATNTAAIPRAVIQLLGKHATLSGESVQWGHLGWNVAIEVSDARGGQAGFGGVVRLGPEIGEGRPCSHICECKGTQLRGDGMGEDESSRLVGLRVSNNEG